MIPRGTPYALTDCSDDGEGGCAREPICNVGGHWKIINRIILESMRGVTLAQLADPPRDDESTNLDATAAHPSTDAPADATRDGCPGRAPELPAVEQPNPDSAPRA